MNIFFTKLKWMLRGKKSLKFHNGDHYIGDIDHKPYVPKSWGARTGRGIYIWANGDIYQGSFVDGKLHGQGTFQSSNGNVLKGLFRNGRYQKESKYYIRRVIKSNPNTYLRFSRFEFSKN